jgi:hypothetical protein
MDKRTMVAVAAILTTLAETDGGSSPASILYIGLGMDHSFYVKVQVILASAGLVTVDGFSVVTITAKGRDIAAQITAATGGKAVAS